MDTLRRAPTGPFPRVEVRRRRFPWGTLVAPLLLLVAVGAALHLWRYQPLDVGTFAASGDHAAGQQDLDGTARGYVYQDGETTAFTMWLHNRGPWGVTVTGVDRTRTPVVPLAGIVEAKLPSDARPVDVAAARPFHSFSLGSGATAPVLVVVRFDGCESFAEGTSNSIESVTVRFRVLGLPRAATIDLPTAIYVTSPPNRACPARQRAPA